MGGLSPKYETLKTKEFEEVYKKGEKFVGSFFIVFKLKNKDELKIGFVASKKIGKAYQRNRAKRLMREIVRINQRLLPNDVYIALIARKSILNAQFYEINDSFVRFTDRFLKFKNEC